MVYGTYYGQVTVHATPSVSVEVLLWTSEKSEAQDSRWRSFGKTQRVEVFRACAADGVVLKHPKDHTLGTACLLIPEWNELHNTESGSDHLLTLIEHRAFKTLNEQYGRGVWDDSLGDRDLITVMMQQRGLAHTSIFELATQLFLGDETYGQAYEVISPEAIAEFQALTA